MELTLRPDSLAFFGQAMFLEAMRQGYADKSAKKGHIDALPGSKVITWDSSAGDGNTGHWQVVDTYFTNPDSDKSEGMTLMARNGHPVWVMHYGGQYPKEVIPFLKHCLSTAYEQQMFHGGRGYAIQNGKGYRYENRADPGSSFKSFSGKEYIFKLGDNDRGAGQYFRSDTKPGEALGYHWYRGLLLIAD